MTSKVQPVGELTAAELQRFCAFLYARTGMQFGESKRYYIERRLFDRWAKTGSTSLEAYLGRLHSDPAEVAQVISSFTVNETYFYREEHQLRALSSEILPEITAAHTPGDKIRIWSVPCSTGEEAYSIAIWLLENWRMVDAYNIEIVGSDIDAAALEAARVGRYGERSLERLSPEVLEAYFKPLHRGGRQLISDLLESLSFTQANLVDRDSVLAHGAFDVIFCRNVLIYFDDASRGRASENLFDALTPGGFICLGHTESMARISSRFLTRRLADAIVYQRPGRG
jgi:chemotaxis protein methyltransferase CheR